MSFTQFVPQQQQYGQQYGQYSGAEGLLPIPLAQAVDLDDFEQLSVSQRPVFVKSSGNSEQLALVNTGDNVEIELDLSQFRPQDIQVLANDEVVVVHAEHEERADKHGSVEREMTRKYVLPEGVEAQDLYSTVNQNGVLKIQTKQNQLRQRSQQYVPIQYRQRQSQSGAFGGQLNRQNRQFGRKLVLDSDDLQQLSQQLPQFNRRADNSEQIELVNTGNKLSIKLDFSQFRPQDIEVKTIGNILVIHAQQQEQTDRFGSVEKELIRRYVLTQTIQPEDVTTVVTKHGILKIEVQKNQLNQQFFGNQRFSPIQFRQTTPFGRRQNRQNRQNQQLVLDSQDFQDLTQSLQQRRVPIQFEDNYNNGYQTYAPIRQTRRPNRLVERF